MLQPLLLLLVTAGRFLPNSVAGWDSPGFLTLDQFNRRQYDSVANPSDGGFKRHAQERSAVRPEELGKGVVAVVDPE